MAIELTPISRIAGDPSVATKGSFIAGTTGLFFLTFSDINGVLFNPSDIDMTILDSDGATVDTIDNADWLELGEYVTEWRIPVDQDPGLYTLRVDYTLVQIGGSSTEFFTETFSVQETDAAVLAPEVIIYRKLLETLVGYTQRIPVFHEIGRLNEALTTASFSFPRWNQPAGARVFVNGNLITSGFVVDYLRGEIVFSSVLSQYDEIQASYTFRWFTDDELDTFITLAVDVFNQYAPHTVYNIATLERNYARAGVTVAHQAAVFVLRRMMFDLHMQEPAKVFGGMERADKLMGSLNNLKQNIEEDLTKLYKEKAKGPYLGLTKTVTVPEFTLPGGRCIAEKSLITYRKATILLPLVYTKSLYGILDDLNVYTIPCDYNQGTVSEMYDLFNSGESIEVLSDKDGILSFEKISHVWKSGTKPLLRIEDEYDNAIEVSNEHIMFVDNKEVPASEVKIGDCLTINLFNSLQESRVVKISKIEETPTFDIEVPSTENLIVNNIKCHNSRWFRYLFKGG